MQYHAEKKLFFEETMIMSDLYQTNMLSQIYISGRSRKQVCGRHVTCTDTLFQVNQYLLLLLNAACLAEKQQIPISQSWCFTEPVKILNLTLLKHYALILDIVEINVVQSLVIAMLLQNLDHPFTKKSLPTWVLYICAI